MIILVSCTKKLTPSSPNQIPAPGYQYITQWGTLGSGNSEFNYPVDIAIDSVSNIYVTDLFNSRVQKFDSLGNTITRWGAMGTGPAQFVGVSGIQADKNDNILVADAGRIQVFDVLGNTITQFVDYDLIGGDAKIASDDLNNIYIANSFSGQIIKFNVFYAYVTHFAINANFEPHPPEVILTNLLWIDVDTGGNVYVSENYNNYVEIFDSAQNLRAQIGQYGANNGKFIGPAGIAVDSSGNMFVADTYNFRVQKFDPSGNYLTQWGHYGSGNGEFKQIQGIAVDSAGYVYVVDAGNNRIQKFGP